MNIVVDLSAFGRHLEATKRHLSLVKTVRQVLSIGSAQVDLRDAAKRLKWLIDNYLPWDPSNEMEPEHAIITGSLFAHAVILYCRATQTEPIGKDRWQWWGLSMVPPHLMQTHRDAMDLRDKALAHFGVGDHMPNGPMVEEKAVALFDGRRVRYGVQSNRAQHRIGFDSALLELTEHTVEVAVGRLAGRFEQFDKELARAMKISPSLIDEYADFASQAGPGDEDLLTLSTEGQTKETYSGIQVKVSR